MPVSAIPSANPSADPSAQRLDIPDRFAQIIAQVRADTAAWELERDQIRAKMEAQARADAAAWELERAQSKAARQLKFDERLKRQDAIYNERYDAALAEFERQTAIDNAKFAESIIKLKRRRQRIKRLPSTMTY